MPPAIDGRPALRRPWGPPEIAHAKANTAVAFRASTGLEERWRERPVATSVVNLGPGQFVIGKGTVLIVIDGTVVGAVGVSGGIPADLDHTIAEAAVRQVRHSAGPRSGKLWLDLLHERLHGRQGAVRRLRGGLERRVQPDLLEARGHPR